MLRLRCYVFGNLVRESSTRELTREELTFLENHRTECEDCRYKEVTSKCSLDAVRPIDSEEHVGGPTKTLSILDNLGYKITQ